MTLQLPTNGSGTKQMIVESKKLTKEERARAKSVRLAKARARLQFSEQPIDALTPCRYLWLDPTLGEEVVTSARPPEGIKSRRVYLREALIAAYAMGLADCDMRLKATRNDANLEYESWLGPMKRGGGRGR